MRKYVVILTLSVVERGRIPAFACSFCCHPVGIRCCSLPLSLREQVQALATENVLFRRRLRLPNKIGSTTTAQPSTFSKKEQE
jgi:hypothetical protein